jgi:hypothetical protein
MLADAADEAGATRLILKLGPSLERALLAEHASGGDEYLLEVVALLTGKEPGLGRRGLR